MRRLVPIGFVVVLVVGLVAVKATQIGTLIHFGAAAQKAGPPPEVVGTTPATEDEWDGTIATVGSVTAVRGVAVSNESAGVVTAIHFESGALVRAGQVLVELDTSVERAQLLSAEARKELAEVSAGRTRQLVGRAAVAKSQLDTDEATLKTSSADSSALKAQIDRKIVRAPFSGRVGLRTVNLGQYLNPGTAVTVLESLGSVYVDFSLPQQQLGLIKVGTQVRVDVNGTTDAAFNGTIGAIDPTVDSTTRTIKLRASVPNKADKLRPGMFVKVVVVLDQKSKVTIAPMTAIVHATYGDSVFVVEKKKDEEGHEVPNALMARQQFVRTGAARGDFVSILDGVKPGEVLVTAGAFKLRNGSGVTVNNDVKPTPSQAPRVENH